MGLTSSASGSFTKTEARRCRDIRALLWAQ